LPPLKNLVKNLRFSVDKFHPREKKSSSPSEFFPCRYHQDQKIDPSQKIYKKVPQRSKKKQKLEGCYNDWLTQP